MKSNIVRLGKKDKRKVHTRKMYKRHGVTTDGSSVSREMAQAARLNMYKRQREVKEDPYTKHPLSFEEFDKIPDIGDLIKEKK